MVVLGDHFPVALTSDIGVLPLHVWIQVVTPQSVVATGIEGLVGGRHGDLMITTEGRFGEQPDIVFYDVIGLHGGDGADLDRWVSNTDAVVIAVTHELRPDLGLAALDRGADAAVSMSASVHDFLEVVDAALSGRLDSSAAVRAAHEGARLGSEVGLTHREADILGRIVRGRSNRAIADECGLSINSVKSYIRSAYRKMDVVSRTQAVVWGVQHGFPLDPEL